jgi:hypothetical protein
LRRAFSYAIDTRDFSFVENSREENGVSVREKQPIMQENRPGNTTSYGYSKSAGKYQKCDNYRQNQ